MIVFAEFAHCSQDRKLFEAGDLPGPAFLVGTFIFILVEGSIELNSCDRSEILIKGEFFGEYESLLNLKDRGYSAKALEDSSIWMFNQFLMEKVFSA